jgi:ABC-type antimicrobial peptide transport system permease subunit
MTFFYRLLRMAVQALLRHKLRSALTTLGIVIGVAAVIATVEIGQGSRTAVAQTIQSMGANNLLIQSGAGASGGVSFGSGTIPTLTPGDADALRRECQPLLVSVSPVVRVRTQVVYLGRNWVPLYLYGTSPDYLDVREWELEEGRLFTDQEVNGAAEVCLLGQTIVRELFGDESPVDHWIRVNNHPMKVIGTLTRKGANTMGLDQDDILLAPWTTIKSKVSGTSATTANQSAAVKTDTTEKVGTGNQRYVTPPSIYTQRSPSQLANYPQPILPTNVDQIHVRVTTEDNIPEAKRLITAILHERHHIRPGQPDDFNIRDMTEIARIQGRTSQLVSWLLLFVASFTLVVGGVGVMTIMLVSVTERTKEIGLRMAVGARARDILRQFLMEAVLLCLAGGAIGILVGRGGSYLVRLIMRWPTEPSLPAVLAAVGVSVAVGMIFGYYPAWKASRLDPIEALRYE